MTPDPGELGLAHVRTFAADVRSTLRERAMRVQVIYGPMSQEDRLYITNSPREQLAISAITESLDRMGIEYDVIDPTILRWFERMPPPEGSLVFINVHGDWGEDGRLQGALDLLGYTYAGSGAAASSLCLNKIVLKRVVASFGVATPSDFLLVGVMGSLCGPDASVAEVPLPVLVKETTGGSSIGMSVIHTHAALRDAVSGKPAAFIEQYVDGVSISVGVLEADEVRVVSDVIAVHPSGGLYDAEVKLQRDGIQRATFDVPASISTVAVASAKALAERIHQIVGCRAFSRTDFVVDRSEKIWFLETNTNPGLSRGGNLATAFRSAGVDYDDMLLCVLGSGLREGYRLSAKL